jgi:hypothetical protein
VPHPHGNITHLLNHPARRRCDDPTQSARRTLGDVLDEVSAALEFRDDLQHRDQVF